PTQVAVLMDKRYPSYARSQLIFYNRDSDKAFHILIDLSRLTVAIIGKLRCGSMASTRNICGVLDSITDRSCCASRTNFAYLPPVSKLVSVAAKAVTGRLCTCCLAIARKSAVS